MGDIGNMGEEVAVGSTAGMGTAEADTAEADIAETDIAETDIAEVGTAEVGTAEVGTAEAGTAEMGTPEALKWQPQQRWSMPDKHRHQAPDTVATLGSSPAADTGRLGPQRVQMFSC